MGKKVKKKKKKKQKKNEKEKKKKRGVGPIAQGIPPSDDYRESKSQLRLTRNRMSR